MYLKIFLTFQRKGLVCLFISLCISMRLEAELSGHLDQHCAGFLNIFHLSQGKECGFHGHDRRVFRRISKPSRSTEVMRASSASKPAKLRVIRSKASAWSAFMCSMIRERGIGQRVGAGLRVIFCRNPPHYAEPADVIDVMDIELNKRKIVEIDPILCIFVRFEV